MQVLSSFDPAATTGGQINVGAADPGCKILLYNLSICAILIDFENGSTAILHAGEANWWELDGSTPSLLWSQYSVLANSSPAISQVTATLYRQDEEIDGTYPMSLTYQLNIGNVVSVSGGSTSVLKNDGNSPGTNVIELTASGSTGSNVTVNNDASGFFAIFLSATYTKIMQWVVATTCLLLGAVGFLVEVLGSLKIDQNLTVVGTSSLDNGKVVSDGTGNITITNNKGLSWDDSFNAPHEILKLNNDNITVLRSGAGAGQPIYFTQADGGHAMAAFTAPSTMQMADNSTGALSNVFGVNGTGDTFVEAHATDNKVIIQDSGGAAIATFSGANKNVSFQQGSLKRIVKFTGTSANGKVSVNPAMTDTPDLVFVGFNVAGAVTAHIIAINYSTLSATNIDVWSDIAGVPFVGVAIKF